MHVTNAKGMYVNDRSSIVTCKINVVLERDNRKSFKKFGFS